MDSLKKIFPHGCPCCSGGLKVSALKCPECGTEVSGTFSLPVFMRLDRKEQDFIMEFVQSSGSLKDMARSMGISYPTVRNYLDELITKIKNTEEAL